jgi:hypothetical protein
MVARLVSLTKRKMLSYVSVFVRQGTSLGGRGWRWKCDGQKMEGLATEIIDGF